MSEFEKKPKKVENPVREWISDNLRYILLIGVIAIGILAIFFIMKAIVGTGSNQKSQSAESSISSQVTETDIGTPATPTPTQEAAQSPTPTLTVSPQASDETQSTSQTDEQTSQQTEESAAEDQSDTQSQTEEAAVQENTLTEADGNVSAVVSGYYNALSSGDAQSAAALVEGGLSQEDKDAITSHAYADSYSNVQVYSLQGDVAGSYVVFVSYEYGYAGYDTALPALTMIYVCTGADGNLYIGSDDTQSQKADYMNSLLSDSEVQALQQQTQERYEAALAADPALAAYVNSL